jgi:hypothetical protein
MNQAAHPLKRRTARILYFRAAHAREHPEHGMGVDFPEAELDILQHDVGSTGRDQIDRRLQRLVSQQQRMHESGRIDGMQGEALQRTGLWGGDYVMIAW